MSQKGLGSVVASVGAGALATMAGLYLAKRWKNYFSRKPKMKLFHNHLYLSTRCTWLISELGAESDFDISDASPGPAYPEDEGSPTELLMLQDSPSVQSEKERKDIEAKYQLVRLNSTMAPSGDSGSDSSDMTHYDMDFYDGDHPRGLLQGGGPTLPAVIVNDEFTMIEGAAICMYLADLYGQFLPPSEQKAEYYSWIVYSAATFDNIIKTLQQQLVETEEPDRDPRQLQPALNAFHAFARALTDALDSRDYLCGNSFSAADCVLGFTLWWAYTIERGRLLQDYPPLIRYLERLKRRPAFQKTFGGEEEWDWRRYFTAYVRGIKR